MSPYLSTSRTSAGETWSVLGFEIPVPWSSPEVKLLREGMAFWNHLENAGIPASVVKIPANYPPAPSVTANSTSGMGTPDLMGTYGTYQVFQDLPEDPSTWPKNPKGGERRRLVKAVGDDAPDDALGSEPVDAPVALRGGRGDDTPGRVSTGKATLWKGYLHGPDAGNGQALKPP